VGNVRACGIGSARSANTCLTVRLNGICLRDASDEDWRPTTDDDDWHASRTNVTNTNTYGCARPWRRARLGRDLFARRNDLCAVFISGLRCRRVSSVLLSGVPSEMGKRARFVEGLGGTTGVKRASGASPRRTHRSSHRRRRGPRGPPRAFREVDNRAWSFWLLATAIRFF